MSAYAESAALAGDRRLAGVKRGQPIYKGKGLYYGPLGVPATGTPTAGQLALAPFDLSRMAVLTSVVAEVTTAGSAGAVVRLGIYADNGSGLWPDALILDAGTIDASTVGNKEITLAAAKALPPGRYWVGGASQGAPTTAPVLRTVGTNGAEFLPSASASASNIPTGAANNSITDALPASFTPAYGTTSAVPRVALRLT